MIRTPDVSQHICFWFCLIFHNLTTNWIVMQHWLAQGRGCLHIICLFNSSDTTNWILMILLQMMHLTSPPSYQLKWDATVNQGCHSSAIFYSFSDSLTWLCTAIFIVILVRSPVSGLVEFQPPEVRLKQAQSEIKLVKMEWRRAWLWYSRGTPPAHSSLGASRSLWAVGERGATGRRDDS